MDARGSATKPGGAEPVARALRTRVNAPALMARACSCWTLSPSPLWQVSTLWIYGNAESASAEAPGTVGNLCLDVSNSSVSRFAYALGSSRAACVSRVDPAFWGHAAAHGEFPMAGRNLVRV